MASETRRLAELKVVLFRRLELDGGAARLRSVTRAPERGDGV
ncbi:MAG: hypothetical protein ACM3ZO_10525 [Clostridia bacterium]